MSVFSVMVGKDIFKCFHIPSFSLTFEVISKKEMKAKNSTIKSWIKIQTEKEVNWYPLKDTFCFYLHIFLCNFLSDNSIITIKLSIFPIFICVWPQFWPPMFRCLCLLQETRNGLCPMKGKTDEDITEKLLYTIISINTFIYQADISYGGVTETRCDHIYINFFASGSLGRKGRTNSYLTTLFKVSCLSLLWCCADYFWSF